MNSDAVQMEVDDLKPKPPSGKNSAKKSEAARRAVTASVDIQWRVIRNNSCFLKYKRRVAKPFSCEPFNPRHGNSLRFNGLLNRKCLDVKLSADKSAVVVSMKKRDGEWKPISSKHSVSLDKAKGLRRIRTAMRGLTKHCKQLDRHEAEKRVHRLLQTMKPASTKGKWPHRKLKKSKNEKQQTAPARHQQQVTAPASSTVMDID